MRSPRASEPTRADVVAWLTSTGAGAAAAVDHHWPGVPPEERARLEARVRQWAVRARRGEGATPEGRKPERIRGDDEDGGGRRVHRPPRRDDLVGADRIGFLEWQLGELIRDLEGAREAGLIRIVAGLDARVSEVRSELDDARGEAGRAVRLDRSPAAVAAAVRARQQELDRLTRARDEAAAHAARERAL